MKAGDRVEHLADGGRIPGTVEGLEPYVEGVAEFVEGIEGVRVLWDGETESTVHPAANIKPIP